MAAQRPEGEMSYQVSLRSGTVYRSSNLSPSVTPIGFFTLQITESRDPYFFHHPRTHRIPRSSFTPSPSHSLNPTIPIHFVTLVIITLHYPNSPRHLHPHRTPSHQFASSPSPSPHKKSHALFGAWDSSDPAFLIGCVGFSWLRAWDPDSGLLPSRSDPRHFEPLWCA